MSYNKVASRYAKSFILLAEEKGALDQVCEDIHSFVTLCEESREFELMLKSPIISSGKKFVILKSIFAKTVHPFTLEIFNIITRKRRENILYIIAQEFFRQYNVKKGIIEAKLFSAQPITEEHKIRIRKFVENKTGKKADIKEIIKKDLLGGFILKIDDLMIDTSISGKLKILQKEFDDNPYVLKY